jgi:hypothetical protein
MPYPPLTETEKYRIEEEAGEAFHRGDGHLDCPYPFGTPANTHWIAFWILEGGTIKS